MSIIKTAMHVIITEITFVTNLMFTGVAERGGGAQEGHGHPLLISELKKVSNVPEPIHIT